MLSTFFIQCMTFRLLSTSWLYRALEWFFISPNINWKSQQPFFGSFCLIFPRSNNFFLSNYCISTLQCRAKIRFWTEKIILETFMKSACFKSPKKKEQLKWKLCNETSLFTTQRVASIFIHENQFKRNLLWTYFDTSKHWLCFRFILIS